MANARERVLSVLLSRRLTTIGDVMHFTADYMAELSGCSKSTAGKVLRALHEAGDADRVTRLTRRRAGRHWKFSKPVGGGHARGYAYALTAEAAERLAPESLPGLEWEISMNLDSGRSLGRYAEMVKDLDRRFGVEESAFIDRLAAGIDGELVEWLIFRVRIRGADFYVGAERECWIALAERSEKDLYAAIRSVS